MGKKDETAKGVASMLASTVGFCAMSGLTRHASENYGIDAYKTTLFRHVIGLGLLGAAALFGRIKLTFVHRPFLLLRGLFGGAAVFAFFLSISKLGIGKGTVISHSFPIFACILGAIFLKEKVGLLKSIAIAGAFLGVYLLAVDDGDGLADLTAFGKYELIAILGAISAGIAIVLVRRLHDTDSSYAIFFAQCAIGLWLVIVPANVVPCRIGYSGGVLLLGIGVSAAVAQLFMTEGYRHNPVTTGALFSMLLPVLNSVVGVTVFHETLSPRTVCGSIVVIASCTAVLMPGEEYSRIIRFIRVRRGTP